MKIKVLTITATAGNRNRFLKQTIESVLAQSYANFHYLIIDNSVNKNAYKLVKKYQNCDRRIFYVHFPETKNFPAHVKNKALDYLSEKHDLIKWLDDDDLFYDNKSLELLVEPFKSKKVFMAYGVQEHIDSTGKHLGSSSGYPYSAFKILAHQFFPSAAAIFRARIVYDLGGFPLIKSCEDIGLVLNIINKARSKNSKIVFLDKCVAKYRRHNKEMSYFYDKNGLRTKIGRQLISYYTKPLSVEHLILLLWNYFYQLKSNFIKNSKTRIQTKIAIR